MVRPEGMESCYWTTSEDVLKSIYIGTLLKYKKIEERKFYNLTFKLSFVKASFIE